MRYLLFLGAAIIGLSANAQNKRAARAAALEKAVSERTYIFNVQSVSSSASGSPGSLSSAYSFKVRPDSVYSDLPYFGSSRFPTTNMTQSPLMFVSTKFDYAMTPGKKGGWDVIIRFKDVQQVQGISLNIGKNGYGTLLVTPADLQSISFSGTIQ